MHVSVAAYLGIKPREAPKPPSDETMADLTNLIGHAPRERRVHPIPIRPA